MYDFLGTLDNYQWKMLVSFYESEYLSIKERIDHLNAEIIRIGQVVPTKDVVPMRTEGIPKNAPVFREQVYWTPTGAVTGLPSMVGKLIQGATAIKMPISIDAPNAPVTIGEKKWMMTPMNKMDDSRPATADGAPAIMIGHFKDMVQDAIKVKREDQEYRLRKIRDLREQLEDERMFLLQQLSDKSNDLAKALGVDTENRGRLVIALVNDMFTKNVSRENSDLEYAVFPSLRYIKGIDLPPADGVKPGSLGPIQKANVPKVPKVDAQVTGPSSKPGGSK